MDDATRLLNAACAGDAQAADEVLPLVYNELRRLAAAKLAREKPGHTLDATGLVHEAYLRLFGEDPARPWEGRRHFFAAAGEAMRRILIESARRKAARKRGGAMVRVDVDAGRISAPQSSEQLLALDEALTTFT